MSNEEIRRQIKGVFKEIEIELVHKNQLELDSFDYMNLIVHIEEIFEIEFEDEYIGNDSFQSIDELVKYVALLLKGK